MREACDSIVGIPMTSMVESLNASVAAGIALVQRAQSSYFCYKIESNKWC